MKRKPSPWTRDSYSPIWRYQSSRSLRVVRVAAGRYVAKHGRTPIGHADTLARAKREVERYLAAMVEHMS